MADIKIKRYYTRNVLIQFAVALAVFIMLIVWQRDFFTQVYTQNQSSSVGWVINGAIVLLFLAGLLRVVFLLFRYMRDEASINRFVLNVRMGEDPLKQVGLDSMMAYRYETLKTLHRKRASINHSALAATLLASESSYNSFPKFVHSTLILTGVFGTIVSLSIALLGASDLVADASQTNSLGTVVHGMSTALSTTMTAIIAYLFFGYFYLKLTDSQTYLISRVEEVTATTLLPHLQISQDAVLKEYGETIEATSKLLARLNHSQAMYSKSASEMTSAIKQLEANTRAEQKQSQALQDMLAKISDQQIATNVQHNEVLQRLSAALERLPISKAKVAKSPPKRRTPKA